MVERAVVIGGGVGGLGAAIALQNKGWSVRVVERAPALEPVGAGIALAPNGLRALDVLGLGEEIRELAAWQGDGGIRAPGGRWLMRTNAEAARERFGSPLVVLHRAQLIDRLVSRLASGTLDCGTTATLVDEGEPGGRPALVRLCAEAGAGATSGPGAPRRVEECEEADLVVAADGVHSPSRRFLFPQHPGPLDSGLVAWRLVTEAPVAPFAPHETWGPGSLWGTQPLADGRTYAYAAGPRPAGGEAAVSDLEHLRRHFGRWHSPVPELLDAARPESLLCNEIHHMTVPLPAHHLGRTVLLGDAAHAMAPMTGQGGNQALEDAVVLAYELTRGGEDLAGSLRRYSGERVPRTSAVVAASARVARAVQVRSRPFVMLRDSLFAASSLVAPGAGLRAMDSVLGWRPPLPAAREFS